MAITAQDVRMWESLKSRGLLPVRPRVLEIGEANWFGDAPLPEGATDPWDAKTIFYQRLLNYESIVAIDMQGPTSQRLDLNQPILSVLGDARFEIVINSGTTEHVFDQCQVFETIHDRAASGGLMVHNSPHAHPDHGFYNYSPIFFEDLAAANGYETLYWDLGEFLCLAFRKTTNKPFKVPMQRSLGL